MLGDFDNLFIVKRISDYRRQIIFSIIVAFLFVLPLLFAKGAIYGDDTHFHLDRVRGLSTVFKSPINFDIFYHAGQGINIFYPWLVVYPFYLLYELFGSFARAWYCYVFILTFLSSIICILVGNKIGKNNVSGYVFSVIYLFCSYHYENAFVRFALGEFVAMSFLPLVLLGYYEIAFGNYKKWYILTIGMTLLIYTHILSIYLCTWLMILITLLSIIFWNQKGKRIASGIKATFFTLAIGAFQYIPMLEQFRYVSLSQPVKPNLADKTYLLNEIIVKSLKNVYFTNLGNVYATTSLPGLIILLILILLICMFMFLPRISKVLTLLSVALLFSMTTLMPWNNLTFLQLSIMQFPWRWLAFISLFVSLAMAIMLKNISFRMVNCLLVICFCISGFFVVKNIHFLANAPVRLPWAEYSARNNEEKVFHATAIPDYANSVGEKYQGNLTPEDPRYQVISQQVLLNNQPIDSEIHYFGEKAVIKVKIDENQSGETYLPFYFYKGQKVEVDGKWIKSGLSPNGTTEIELHHGTHQIVIYYTYTTLSKISFIISLISFIAFIALISLTAPVKRKHKKIAKDN